MRDGNHFWTQAAPLVRSGCVGFEPYRAKVMSRGKAYIGVERGGQAPQQGNGGLGGRVWYPVIPPAFRGFPPRSRGDPEHGQQHDRPFRGTPVGDPGRNIT
jgi:hypothetical protein